MKWSDLITTLPQEATRHREEIFLQQVSDGNFLRIRWAAVSCTIGEHMGIVYVASDALQLGERGDSCRANFTHYGAQTAADTLGTALPTERIADMMHAQASVIIPPQTDVGSMNMGRGAFTSTMERHSRRVDMAAGAGQYGVVSTVGKHWITHNKLRNKPRWGVNYGWHSTSAPYTGRGGMSMWQTVGTRHNWHHVDYSQVLVLVNRIMLVNGEEKLLEDVMVHPELSELVSYDGPMAVTRHPDVQEPVGGVGILRI